MWNRDARSFYYLHGPLARIELGEGIVGNDYRYTMQGWIKGVNLVGSDGTDLEAGEDGYATTGNANRWMARDEMAYTLGYNNNDYTPIGVVDAGAGGTAWADMDNTIRNWSSTEDGLFNGNIAFMLTDLPELARHSSPGVYAPSRYLAASYQYDQLHRIKASHSYSYNSNNWTADGAYNTEHSYDALGNITHLKRWAKDSLIDDLSYAYNKVGADLQNNKLRHVTDPLNGGMGDLTNQAVDNYSYDEIGNLVSDQAENIQEIRWTLQGKVKRVIFSDGRPDLVFTYDALGNRLSKKQSNTTTYYVRDATGQPLAIYSYETDGSDVSYSLEDLPIYGSERIGQYEPGLVLYNETALSQGQSPTITVAPVPSSARYTAGLRRYEQSNHLGNVLAVVTDKAIGQAPNANGQASYYLARVVQASGYYPFGWTMPGKKVESGYRYGFQGQEEDVETGLVSYKYRMHNPRLGRFFAMDPLAADFPWNSVYAFSENRVLDAIELEGREAFFIHGTTNFDVPILGNYNTGAYRFRAKHLVVQEIPSLFGNCRVDIGFKWSGDNTDEARKTAGEHLAAYIMAQGSDFDEPITLVGHSHGGNVAIEAALILVTTYRIPAGNINIVALNTPEQSEQRVPKGSNIHLYSINAYDDMIQDAGADVGGFDFDNGVLIDNPDSEIFFPDQFGYNGEDEGSSLLDNGGCGVSHHCPSDANFKEWYPILRKAKDEVIRGREYHFRPPQFLYDEQRASENIGEYGDD